jgi:transcriptional regulator with XRE-family HTH domain
MQGGKVANFWGGLIRDLRTERGLSQRQLAFLAQVNRSTLRRIEDGTARGDIDLIERLLRVSGYELEAMHRDEQRKRLAADPVLRSRLAFAKLSGGYDWGKQLSLCT